ncbi:MAG: hypothetical protein COW54_02610 [Rhodobacteraceae bacterium CG17_big_fil_post_rev_8_21_14_2_50_63_15]|nr:MAG: hypothetical protein COW54_02610 [Rhodobacteraceae bacterium CG17_big_fil_post_rev_8_21_14_2_50_63_15]
MAAENGHGLAIPSWFADPGEGDVLAWVALALIVLALYGLVTLYAAFDRWAERQSHGTPLARTIPTMLLIALLYEIFPLGHFNILLPISAILIAMMADWSRFHLARGGVGTPVNDAAGTQADTHPTPSQRSRAAGDAGHV